MSFLENPFDAQFSTNKGSKGHKGELLVDASFLWKLKM